jgi:hypothetical protein
MHRLRPRKPSPSMVVAVTALLIALGGTASAALGPANGNKLIKKHTLSGNRLKNKTITAAQINLRRLGTVPNATRADTASSADTATNAVHAASADSATSAGTATSASTATDAGHATDSDELGGSPSSAFQSRVTGACSANSAVAQVNADGSVGCTNVDFYSGRRVEPLNGNDTFLTIPSVAHAISLNCQAGGANAELINDASGTTDVWLAGDANYVATNWGAVSTVFSATNGAVFHLGQGSGAGAKVITITISTHATGSNCIFQGSAEVITAG